MHNNKNFAGGQGRERGPPSVASLQFKQPSCELWEVSGQELSTVVGVDVILANLFVLIHCNEFYYIHM